VGNVLCSDLEEDLEVRTKQTLVLLRAIEEALARIDGRS